MLALCAAICAALGAAAPAASAQGAFPPTPVGASSAQLDIVLANDDPVPVTLGQPAVIGPDAAAFSVVGGDCADQTLSGDDACAVTLALTPARIGPHTATLEVPVEGDPDAPFSVELTGEGIPWLRLSPPVLDFGPIFAPATQHVLVENVSGREISLLPRIEPAAGDFRRSFASAPDRCEGRLAAGASCRIGIQFRPRPGIAAEGRLVYGGQVEMGSVILRGTGAPRPPIGPITFPTPDATAVLRKRLRAALARLRGRSRAALLKRGLVVRAIVPPALGVLRVMVDARRGSSRAPVLVARGRLAVQPGRAATVRARLTRAGRRLLRSDRRLVLDVRLTLVARSDDRLSRATGVLRLGRVMKRASG